jgi:hypothetical protein
MKWPFRSDKSRAEAEIEAFELPPSLAGLLRRQLEGADWAPVERSLRDWFICCANAKGTLGMPSRVVQWVWEAFSQDASYDAFCDATGIRPDPQVALRAAGGDWKSLARTVEAWDRSATGGVRDTPLWSLDEELQIDNPIGFDVKAIEQLRSKDDPRYGGPFAYGGSAGGGM